MGLSKKGVQDEEKATKSRNRISWTFIFQFSRHDTKGMDQNFETTQKFRFVSLL